VSASFGRFIDDCVVCCAWVLLVFALFLCYNCSCLKGYTSLCLVGCAVSVLASSSVFAGVVSVGFSGSRSPSVAASAALLGGEPRYVRNSAR
jgi:hypothetical protein